MDRDIHDEELLEKLYWQFDADRSANPENERLLFKGKLRYYARKIKEEADG